MTQIPLHGVGAVGVISSPIDENPRTEKGMRLARTASEAFLPLAQFLLDSLTPDAKASLAELKDRGYCIALEMHVSSYGWQQIHLVAFFQDKRVLLSYINWAAVKYWGAPTLPQVELDWGKL